MITSIAWPPVAAGTTTPAGGATWGPTANPVAGSAPVAGGGIDAGVVAGLPPEPVVVATDDWGTVALDAAGGLDAHPGATSEHNAATTLI
ncbi:MAG: hypothetical protein F2789_07540 [Actinobacteria bacterium]|nr:hypothetical protein [Actinomycetota bacterium]